MQLKILPKMQWKVLPKIQWENCPRFSVKIAQDAVENITKDAVENTTKDAVENINHVELQTGVNECPRSFKVVIAFSIANHCFQTRRSIWQQGTMGQLPLVSTSRSSPLIFACHNETIFSNSI